MSSTALQRMPQQTGFRKNLAWFFVIAAMLYIIYSSSFLVRNDCQCTTSEENVVDHLTNLSNFSTAVRVDSEEEEKEQKHEEEEGEGEHDPPPERLVLPQRLHNNDTQVNHIVFGIAASADLWEKRKEYVKVWWRPEETRGIVWMDRNVRTRRNERLPEIKVSADTSRFKYSNKQGHRSALRISRVVSETLRLGLKDVRWFVMGDDDTVFMVDNVVRILSKYDHNQFYYVGSSSESHLQNIFFSYEMAYGGGGFAISYPLAVELSKVQDRCIQRYPGLYGSDDRIQACMAELGVPLSKEHGFHQYDVYGDLLGLLAAHPVTPLASIHHLDVVEPVFPGMTRPKALNHLFQAVNIDSASIMQQSVCYDSKRYWSISVSWGFVVQIWRGVISPRELEMPTRTFLNWYRKADYTAYAFNTRPVTRHPCQKPFVYYMNSTKYDRGRRQTIGVYSRHKVRPPYCRWRMESPETIKSIIVLKRPDSLRWQKSPRRDCCRVLKINKASTMYLWVGNCRSGEISELQKQK